MFSEQWHPIHWAILAMGIVMILFMFQLKDHKTTRDQIQSPNNDSLIIEQSHEFNFDCIDVNAFIINGDTIANENI